MDFLNKLANEAGKSNQQQQQQHPQAGAGGGLFDKVSSAFNEANHHNKPAQQQGSGGLMGMINNGLGGGAAGEAKEDTLDKAIDFVQEHVFHQGPQDNESAIEQMKDKQIADAIKGQFGKLHK